MTNFIKSHVPAATLEQNTTQEFTFVLPDNSVKRGGFEIFFSDLEAKQDELGIDSFGLTDTSLEEVIFHRDYGHKYGGIVKSSFFYACPHLRGYTYN